MKRIQNGITALKQLATLAQLGIALVIGLCLLCGTNIGLKIILSCLGYFFPIETHNIQGSLFSNQITIERLTYHLDEQHSAQFHGLSIKGIQPLLLDIESIHTQSALIPLQGFSAPSNTSSISPTIRHLCIDTLQFIAHDAINPLTFENINVNQDNNNFDVSFEYNQRAFNADVHHSDDSFYTITAHSPEGTLQLQGLIDERHIHLNTTPFSDLENITLKYFPDTGRLNAQIDHHKKDVQIKADVKTTPSDNTYFMHLETLVFSLPNFNINATGLIDTTNKIYHLDSHINQSFFKVRHLQEQSFVLQGYISELSSLSPYAEGDCHINIAHTPQVTTVSAHTQKISLPFAKIFDAQMTFDSKNNQILNFSASQLRNPLILLDNPSLSIQKNANGYKLLTAGFQHGIPHQINADIQKNNDAFAITVEKMNIPHKNNTSWAFKQKHPIYITPTSIATGLLTLFTPKQSIELDFQADLLTQQWSLKNAFHDTALKISTQGIVDIETEVNIEHMMLNGQATISGTGTEDIVIDGQYNASELQASLLNVVPDFPFPLDYYVEDGNITWNNGQLFGELSSSQGTIAINSSNEGIHISSPNIHFSHLNSELESSLDFTFTDELIAGQLHLKQAKFSFNPSESFKSFPKDIDIIGEITTTKPEKSNVEINLEIHADNTPLNIYGFQGLADTDLIVRIPKIGPSAVSGKVILSEPSLTMLNRKIPIDTFEVTYNQQHWLSGQIKLDISKSITAGSATSNASNAEIKLSVFGPINAPAINISSTPVQLSQIEIVSHIFSSSEQLPPGNENYHLVEVISGMKRNQGLVVFLQALNHMSKFLNFDISLRPGYDQNQAFSDSLRKADLILSKQLYKKVWLIIRHQINEEMYTYALNLKLNPWLSAEAQYNRKEVAASLFFNN